MKRKKFRLGELFCGPGGIACGAIHAKSDNKTYSIEHVWANDFDLDTCETYRKNICPDSPDTVYCCDVRELDINKADRPLQPQVMKTVTVETFGVDYPEPEKH